MEQFRKIGEVLGSMKALMVLQDDIPINRRQCCLLFDMFTLAFTVLADEIRQNLKLEEKSTKWKPLEEPLRELHRVFKEGESYVRSCLDSKDWWGKAVVLHQNRDSIEFHIHNLLSYFPAAIEAIEIAGEISGLDQEEMQKKRVMLAKKYDRAWNDPKLFQWRFGKQYLVPREICCQLENAMREDRWLLIEAIREKKKSGSVRKSEQQFGNLLIKKLNGVEPSGNFKLPPSSILVGSEDYQVRRRIGSGGQYKEIQWLGETFALRDFFEDIEKLSSEISTLLSLSHPNIVQYLCGFYDEEKKECFLVMELLTKDLYNYVKENSSPKRRALFPLPIVVDIMFQVARGMEYLHSRKIYHGDLNPTNILLKPRKSTEGYFHVKVSGFGLTSVENQPSRYASPSQTATLDPNIWNAPEVHAEKEGAGGARALKYTEKADVYSFGMLCFQLLTGKLPFEDGHLQGDQMTKNIRAGERPLFPSLSPKYLVSLTKRCWHTNPSHRPSFSSISRVLRYIKKFIVMNPSDGQPHLYSPPVDYSDLEAGFLKKFPAEVTSDPASVTQIPFQMFAYRLAEKERTSLSIKLQNPEEPSEAASNDWDEDSSAVEDPFFSVANDARSVTLDVRETKSVCFDLKSVRNGYPEKKIPADLRSIQSEPPEKKILLIKKPPGVKIRKTPGKPKVQTPSKQSWSPTGRVARYGRETNNHKPLTMSPLSPRKRTQAGQASRP